MVKMKENEEIPTMCRKTVARRKEELRKASKIKDFRSLFYYSNSMVPGGFEVMS